MTILKDIIIKNSNGIYSRATITIADGIIENIQDSNIECRQFCPQDFYVTRGFVNSHLHPNQLLDRRLLDELSITELLHKMHIDYKKTYEDRYSQAIFVLTDAIKSGATSAYAVASDPLPVVQAFRDIGLTGAITCFFNDQWEGHGNPPKQMDLKTVEEEFAKLIKNAGDGLAVHIGSASVQSASDDLLMLFDALAKRYHTKVNIHVSEGKESVESCIQFRGTSPIRLLAKLGVLGAHWNLIHATSIDEDEVKLIADAGASVIHCPVSNAKTGVGISPIHALMKHGVNIGLGTDACSNNNTNNILNEAYFSILLHGATHQDPTIVKENNIFKWLTVNGFKILGMPYTGKLEVGEPADLLLWSLGSSAFVPLPYRNFNSALINNAPDIKPHSVFIKGKKVVDNYKFIGVSEEEIYQRANACGEKIVSSMAA